jgi:SsrA-binding protein
MEILNRKARYDYEIFDCYEAGIELTGTEIKSIRNGSCNLKDSYVIIRNNECFILNMHITNYDKGSIFNAPETRTRKLLLHKDEILKLSQKIEIKGYTLVPLKLYFKNGKAKLEIGVAKGKHTYDKKEAIKEKDIKRDTERALKERYR